MFSTQSFIKPAHKIALNLGYSPDTYSSSLQTSNQTFKHGNSLKPGQLSLSRLLGNAAALAACWPPPRLLLPRPESLRPLGGGDLFFQTRTSIVTLHLICFWPRLHGYAPRYAGSRDDISCASWDHVQRKKKVATSETASKAHLHGLGQIIYSSIT